MEKELPDMGLVQMQDLESGKQIWVDSASRNLRKEYAEHFEENRLQNEQSFFRLKADFLSLDTSDNYISVMMQMFKRRGQRR